MIISSSNATLISNDSIFYDLRQSGSIGVLIRLTSNEFTETSALPQVAPISISNKILIYYEEFEAKIFIPSCESQ